MRKYFIVLISIIFTLTLLISLSCCKNKGTSSTTKSTKQGELIQLMSKNQIISIPNSIIWGKTSFDNVTLKLNYKSTVKPTELIVGRDHPNGIRILALFPGYGVHLPVKYEKDFGGFNDYGELNEGYYIQVVEYDFDRDDAPEIIVAVGNGLTDLAVNIVKYNAPKLPKDAGRNENWSLVGSFSGQEKVLIEGNTISLPYGSQGLYTKYTWSKNKFAKSN